MSTLKPFYYAWPQTLLFIAVLLPFQPDYAAGRSAIAHKGPAFKQVGTASWYGPGFHGKKTANGDTFNQHKLTAAHRTLPLGTAVEVTNINNGKSIEVTITDRGPYVKGRVIDLSRAAAIRLGMKEQGLAKVKIEADT
jgi:rare lipoprotein A